MAKFQIKINSILGGISANAYQGRADQFHASIGIDPDRPIQTSGVTKTAGVLTPSSASDVSGAVLSGYPVWITTNPKGTSSEGIYVYASDGEFISYVNAAGTGTLEGTPTSGVGNGMAYYNNYIYLATPTDISHYGPLTETPVLTNTRWTGSTGAGPTFNLTALGNATYPTQRGVTIPNHPMHVHSDNKLYVGDFDTIAAEANRGRGLIHWIRTTRTTDEGDTNDGTTRSAFLLTWGYAPTDIESWGTDLVVAAIYVGGANTAGTLIDLGVAMRQPSAKLFFWDAINAPSLPYKVVDLPDPLVTALLNHNGNLYIWTGSYGSGIASDSVGGTRLSVFAGGYSIKQLAFLEEGLPPIAGGVAASGGRIVWGGYTSYPEDAICMWGYGYKDDNLPKALHNIAVGSPTIGASLTTWTATAVAAVEQPSFGADPRWWMGWKDGAATQDFGIDRINAVSNTSRLSVWRSFIYPIGQPFKINKISLPLGSAVAADMTLIPIILTDDLSTSTAQTTINSTNYAASQRRIVLYPTIQGLNNFCLQLRWSGIAILPVNLPIIIEGETLNDATG